MPNTIEDFEVLRPPQLVTAFNAGMTLLGKTEDDHVKKFRDARTGVARVTKIRDDLLAMFGHAILREMPDGTYFWEVEKSATRPSGEEAAPRVGATTLDLTQQIHLLVETNPKRAGSRAHGNFALYLPAATGDFTGEDYVNSMVAAGFTRKLALANLHWDIDHNYVRLGDGPSDKTQNEQPSTADADAGDTSSSEDAE